MERKAPSDPSFHPSRDVPHWIGDTTSTGQTLFVEQGEHAARATVFGRQGGTNPATGEWDSEPRNLSRLHTNDPFVLHQISRLAETSVPLSHWRGGEKIVMVGKGMPGAEGYYRPAPNISPSARIGSSIVKPQIGVSTMAGPRTLVHEMGHAHHYDVVTSEAERGNLGREYRDARDLSPDPLREGIADAYVDRYGGPGLSAAKTPGDYSHISDRQFGYSSHYEENEGKKAVWDDPDRLVYAGARAHFGETGEIPRYQQAPGMRGPSSGRAIADATIAMLHEHSPHARAAWGQLSIGPTKTLDGEVVEKPRQFSDMADAAVRRHKDRTLLSQGQFVQESLFDEIRGAESGEVRGYTPSVNAMSRGQLRSSQAEYVQHMDRLDTQHGEEHVLESMNRNQLGEAPRTRREIQTSLGAEQWAWGESLKKGFA